jgi:hypothetical protein
MRQTLLSVLFLLLPMLASADKVEIDGIYYNLDANNKTAEVTYGDWEPSEEPENYDGRYAGVIMIPNSFEHEGIKYKVTSIGFGAFEKCSLLGFVNIGNYVTSIGQFAFAYSGLTSVGFPVYGPTTIGDCAFFHCENLSSVTIYDCVTSIGDKAFWSCSSLFSVTIGDGVTSIGNCAFQYCYELYSLTIGNSVTSIGNNAFDFCEKLRSVTIPNSVSYIGEKAFNWCTDLRSIILGGNVKEIGPYAFAECWYAYNVYCYAENAPDISASVFDNSQITKHVLHVPAGSVEAYQAAGTWGNFKEILPIGDFNNDGKINTTDITNLVNYISGNPPENYSKEDADANGDGKVNIADVVKITGTIKKPNWVKVGTGTFWYDGLWFDYDEEGNEVPFVDPGYELFQQEGTNLYKITDWGGGVDYIFTWDKETNVCATQMGYVGYTDPDYGEVSVVDVCTYWSDLSYEDWPSHYYSDPEYNAFYFYNVYVVEAGYWGPYLEYFEVEWDADATPAPARTKTLKKRPHITNLTPKNK